MTLTALARKPFRSSNLQYLSSEARPVDLHPEKVFYSKQLPLMVTVTLHCLKVAPRTLLAHDSALQLLEYNIMEIFKMRKDVDSL